MIALGAAYAWAGRRRVDLDVDVDSEEGPREVRGAHGIEELLVGASRHDSR